MNLYNFLIITDSLISKRIISRPQGAIPPTHHHSSDWPLNWFLLTPYFSSVHYWSRKCWSLWPCRFPQFILCNADRNFFFTYCFYHVTLVSKNLWLPPFCSMKSKDFGWGFKIRAILLGYPFYTHLHSTDILLLFGSLGLQPDQILEQ